MSAPKAAWVDGVCKTCGAYTHSCKCEHPPTPDFMKSFFAAPQEGAGSTAGPATNGEPAAAASWLDTIPTAADGVTCRIEDVRRAFIANHSARPEAPRSEEVAVLAAAKRLAHYLEEGWDEQDDPADVAEADGACDGLVKAVKALLCAPSQQQLRSRWQPIETAPRTGEHVLIAKFDGGTGFGWIAGKHQPMQVVAHWFEYGNVGFYGSVYGGDQQEPFDGFTHWQPLPEKADG